MAPKGKKPKKQVKPLRKPKVPRGTSKTGTKPPAIKESTQAEQTKSFSPEFEAHKFKPGQSGNPAGRPPTKLMRDALLRRIGKVIATDRTEADAIVDILVDEAKKGKNLSYIIEIMDRIDGKVPAKTDLSSEDGSMSPVPVVAPRFNISFRGTQHANRNKK